MGKHDSGMESVCFFDMVQRKNKSKLHNQVGTACRWEEIFAQTQSGKRLKSQIFKRK